MNKLLQTIGEVITITIVIIVGIFLGVASSGRCDR